MDECVLICGASITTELYARIVANLARIEDWARENRVLFGVIFKRLEENDEPWSITEQATKLAHVLRQRVRIFQFLWMRRFNLSLQILSFTFDGWLGGLQSNSGWIRNAELGLHSGYGL
jgi:hypothetical protein